MTINGYFNLFIILVIWLGVFGLLINHYRPWKCNMVGLDKWFAGVLCFIWPICLVVLVILAILNFILNKKEKKNVRRK